MRAVSGARPARRTSARGRTLEDPVTHICIVTRNAPAANPRVVKETKALAGAGYRVTLVCGVYGGWSEALGENVLAPECAVKRVRFGPTVKTGLRVVQLARRRAFRAFAHLSRHEPVAFRAFGDAGAGLAAAARCVDADLFVGHLPEGLGAAARAAASRGVPFAFDAEDFHPGDRPDTSEHAFENRLLHAIESRHLPRCRYVTAASPGIADAYAARYGIARPTVVLNTFPKATAPARPICAGTQRPGPSLYWFSQTIGPNRGLECAVRAVAVARTRPHLYLRGDPVPGYFDRLRTLAAEAGSADRLHLLRPASPANMVALSATHDIGFVGETGHTLNRRIALTNKQFTYLLAGIPVVMSDVPAHEAFAAEARGAVWTFRTDDAEALARVLDDLLSDPEALARARIRAFTLGQQRFHWEQDQSRLLKLVCQATVRDEAGV